MSERLRQKKLREDLQSWQDHPMGTAMAIQRLAREVAELNEVIDALLDALEKLIKRCENPYKYPSFIEETPEVQAACAAIAKARGEQCS